jgi:hypothetical protein
MDPEINDQVNLKWPSILIISGLDLETIKKTNLLVSNSYH